MSLPAFKRRILFVSFKEQFKIMFFGLFLNIVVFIFLYLISRYCLELLFQQTQTFVDPKSAAAFKETYLMVYTYLDDVFLLSFLVCTFGLFTTSVLLSHRIVGPIFKITRTFRHFNETGATEPLPLSLRKDDFFHELAYEINKFLSKYKKS